MPDDVVLKMRNISKRFSGVIALDHVDFNARRGKVNVLMGENGAGKSTLMKILAGAHRCDEGEIFIEGKQVKISSPESAMKNKIAMIYQELNLVKQMTVEENIFLGREETVNGFLKKKELLKKAGELMEQYDVHLDTRARVGDLSVANQQMLEIIKALSLNAEIIIMDEPTSSLSLPEVRRLFTIIHKLNDRGITIIYISHRMDEIFEIGDYITIMRDGKLISESPMSEISEGQIIKALVGREISQIYPPKREHVGEVILSVKNLGKRGLFEDISFDLHKGEVLGISGLVGAGRTEMAMTLFGAYQADAGTIQIHGENVVIDSPKKAMAHKIAYIPEDRKALGVNLDFKIISNIALTNMDVIAPFGFIKRKLEYAVAKKMVERLRIKASSVEQLVGNLSGGNQQKVVLAKWLNRDLDILILDEPTRGVDVGAKQEIHRLVAQLAEQGMAIILISSELPEVIGMSDRIMVMHEGKQKVILDATADVTQEVLMSYSIGTETAS